MYRHRTQHTPVGLFRESRGLFLVLPFELDYCTCAYLYLELLTGSMLSHGHTCRKDSLDFLKDLEMGLLSVGMSSTCGESDQEFPGSFDKDSLRNMTSTSSPPPMPVLLPNLRAEYSPQVKQCSTYAPNQFSLSDMTFDATFNHDYNPQAPIVTVKSGKEMDCIDPVGVSVGPLQAARVRTIDVVSGCYLFFL